MKFEFTWVDPSLVICRISGPATVSGIAALVQVMTSHPKFRPGMNVLADQTSLDVSSVKTSDLEQLAEVKARLVHETGVRIAFVSGPGPPVRYALMRMFASLTEPDAETSLRVFETFDEAMAWINEGKALVSSEQPNEGVQAPPQEDP